MELQLENLLDEDGTIKKTALLNLIYHPARGFTKPGASQIEELNYLRAIPLLHSGYKDPDNLRELKIDRFLKIEEHWFESIYNSIKDAFSPRQILSLEVRAKYYGSTLLDVFLGEVLPLAIGRYEQYYVDYYFEAGQQPSASDYIRDYEGSVKRSPYSGYCIEKGCWGKRIKEAGFFPGYHCQFHHIPVPSLEVAL